MMGTIRQVEEDVCVSINLIQDSRDSLSIQKQFRVIQPDSI